MPDAWADLGIPDFLRISPEERKAAWKDFKPPQARKAPKRPFHLPKTIEPAGLKLLKEMERDAERKKAERLEALKALPKKPRTKRKPRHVKPRRTQSRRSAAKQPPTRIRKLARARQRD